MLAGERHGTFRTARDYYHLSAAFDRGSCKFIGVGSAGDPSQILIAELYDIRHARNSCDAVEIGWAVLDEARSDIGIEIDNPALMLAPAKSLDSRAAGLGDERKGSQVQSGNGLIEVGNVGNGNHPAGRSLVDKGVARLPASKLHEGKDRIAIGYRRE